MTHNARLGLAFAAPAPQKGLGLPQTLTRRLIKQKARHHCRGSSDTLWAHGFRYYFTPLTAVLFTFPSRYLFTIGCQVVFRLIQWSGRIHTEFHVHRVTWDTSRRFEVLIHPAVTVYGPTFQMVKLTSRLPHRGPSTPRRQVFLV